jgi:sRNA-binding carbon storage regulator CsrA
VGLVLKRTPGQAIRIGSNIRVEFRGFGKGRQIDLAIDCPKHVKVVREEIAEPEPKAEAASESPFYLWWVAEFGLPPGPEQYELFNATRKAWLAARRSTFTEYTPAEIKGLIEDLNPDALFFESPDYSSALIGMTEDGRAVYEQTLCIETLVDDETDWTDAADFFCYNTLRALEYQDSNNRPVIVSLQP